MWKGVWVSTGRRKVAPIALAALVSMSLGGCQRSEGGALSETEATPAASPTIVDGEPCPAAPADLDLSEDVGCVSATTGSFEPEQGQQTLTVYALVNDRRLPVEWRMRVTRRTGRILDEGFRTEAAASYPVVIGSEDADGRGLDEVFVKLVTHSYHSGKTQEVGIFGVRDGRFFRVMADGEPLLFQVGGVSVFGEGAECRDVNADGRLEFLLLRVDGVTNDVQSTVERVFSWKDRSLYLLRRTEGRFAKAGYSDPLLWRFYSFRCLGFDPGDPYSRG